MNTITTAASRRSHSEPQRSWPRRIAPVLGVFFLAPVLAEYLVGYDTSTGDPGALLFGLLFLAPLYGCPALIIREVTRRAGRGWPTMMLLAFGFGVIQAGLIDHSLFNPSYRDIDYWQAMLIPTYVPALGIGVDPTLDFILGHVIWSFSLPIALVETFVPERRTTPWLGKFGMALVVVLYLLISALIFNDHVTSEQFLPSPGQLIGAAAVVVACFVAAFAVGRQPRQLVDRPVPSTWRVGCLAFAALNLSYVIDVGLALLNVGVAFDATWWDVAGSVVMVAGLAIAVTLWSRSTAWNAAHRLALAAAALLSHVWLAFLVEPLGDVPLQAKLLHNVGFAIGSLVLLIAAGRAARQTPVNRSAAAEEPASITQHIEPRP
ncbi:MAG TPA: hypothetical protein VGD58_25530 [Herpetosiphonaceae bacterium]